MVAHFILNPNLHYSEKFVLERLIELLFNKTIDSYRVRLHNPKTIIKEFRNVITDWHFDKIKHFKPTVEDIISEMKLLLETSDLNENGISVDRFKGIVSNVKDERNLKYKFAYAASNKILAYNENYGHQLIQKIKQEIVRLKNESNKNSSQLNDLNRLCGYFASELIDLGYSKGYLYSVLWRLNEEGKTFDQIVDFFENLCVREQESFDVIFKITIQKQVAQLDREIILNEVQIRTFASFNSKTASFFANKKDNQHFIRFHLNGKDYKSVIKIAKHQLSERLDTLNWGFFNAQVILNERVLVVGTNDPSKAKTHPLNYIMDGAYKGSQLNYERINALIFTILNNNAIASETKQKTISAFRYLRLGDEAIEIEQKFINYWIGLEYIFSNYEASSNTVVRLKDNFISCHANVYFTRNLKEFHADIKRIGCQDLIPNFSNDLSYLLQENIFDTIENQAIDSHPLVAFRANKLKSVFNNLKREIDKHKNNLTCHFTRCYRMRNEIVHDAAINTNIQALAGHLRYYLAFILSTLTHYLYNNPQNADMNEKISIDDFFILEQLDNQQIDKFSIQDFINRSNPTEFFF